MLLLIFTEYICTVVCCNKEDQFEIIRLCIISLHKYKDNPVQLPEVPS